MAITADWSDDTAAAGAFGREPHQSERDQAVDDGPDQDLVGDALGQEGGRLYEGTAERERRIIGQRRDEGGQDEGRGPAPAAGCGMRGHGAVGNLRQPQPGIHRRFQQPIERADQKRHKTEQRDQRADLLAEPDLVVDRAGRAALQGFGEPVEAVADGLVGDVLGRMGDGGV